MYKPSPEIWRPGMEAPPLFPTREQIEAWKCMPSMTAHRRSLKPIAQGWTPALSGYVLFLDGDQATFSDSARTTAATNGGAVKGWSDQSGNAHHATTNNTGNTLTTSDLNGHSTVGSTTGGANFDITFTQNQPYTVFLVMRYVWTGTANLFVTDPSGGVVMLQQSATVGDIRRFAGSGVHSTGTGYADSTWQIYCLTWNGASSQLRINANTVVTQNPGAGNPTGITLLPNATNQKLAAVLLYPTALSTSDETIERNDINTRFAIF